MLPMLKGSGQLCSERPLLCLQAQPRAAQQKLTLRLQRPTVVAEVIFMLAVTKFFVPGFAMSGVTPIPFTSSDLLLQGGLTSLLLCWWLNKVCCRSRAGLHGQTHTSLQACIPWVSLRLLDCRKWPAMF